MTDNSDCFSNGVSKFEMKAIINDCIKNNFHIFLAFDVVDGNITPKEYFNKVIEESRRKKQSGDSV